MFTKQHYVAVADAISTVYQNPRLYPYEQSVILLVIDALGDLFSDDNPNFNEALFRKACGYGQEA